MSNYLGRCKGEDCGYALFATPQTITQGESFRDVQVGRAARVGNNGVFGRCPANHKVFPLKLVQGTFSEAHQCDSRCLNAKGAQCTCSCGGANHGRGHAATVIDAGEEIPESFHIGEIDRTIRGTATVIRKAKGTNEGDRSRAPYTFRTDKGAIIVYWQPQFITDPDYKVGQRVTFRAKVKSHDNYNGTPQTRVTYFEEVES